jgi:hypothetical protein
MRTLAAFSSHLEFFFTLQYCALYFMVFLVRFVFVLPLPFAYLLGHILLILLPLPFAYLLGHILLILLEKAARKSVFSTM